MAMITNFLLSTITEIALLLIFQEKTYNNENFYLTSISQPHLQWNYSFASAHI